MPKNLTRSELIEKDLYRSEALGYDNTKRNKEALREHHAKTLNALGETRDGDTENEKFTPKDITWTGTHICDSYKNPAIYCVYDEACDPCWDSCLYCGGPYERK